MNLKSISLQKLSRGLAQDEIDIFEYLESASKLIKTQEKAVNALLPSENPLKRWFAEAKKLKETFPLKEKRPPLYGILCGVKDIIHVDGFTTKAGSKVPPHLFQASEAKIVQIIKSLGAIVLGKTVTTEFAFLDPGPTRNPLNLNHTPGGSSSGSAAAVAAKYCPLSIGTQTIGSVIRPASFCGIVGFKPTQGLLSNQGIIPLAATLDQLGFFTFDLTDMEYFYQSENNSFESKNLELNIGIVEGKYLQQANREIQQDFNKVTELVSNKFPCKRKDFLEDINEINRDLLDILAAEKASYHQKIFEQHRNLYSSKIAQSIERGLKIDNFQLQAAKKRRLQKISQVQTKMASEKINIIISPATCEYPPSTLKSTGNPMMNAPWTYLGFPVLTIPIKIATRDFPLGLQITALPHAEGTLFSAAKKIQQLFSQ